MEQIHLVTGPGQSASYNAQDVRRMWQEGKLSPDTLYWKEGMADWQPISTYFGTTVPSTAPIRTAPLPVLGPDTSPYSQPWAKDNTQDDSRRTFLKDPLPLTRYLKVMFSISAGTAVLSCLFNILELIQTTTGNTPRDDDPIQIMFVLFGLVVIIIYIATGIPFLKWIYRSAKNVQAFGATLKTSPSMAVGYYFVPFANLYRPFQAVQEIWKASANPDTPDNQSVPSYIGVWWTLWVLSNLLGQISFRLEMGSTETTELTSVSTVISLISDGLDFPLSLLARKLVTEITELQQAQTQR